MRKRTRSIVGLSAVAVLGAGVLTGLSSANAADPTGRALALGSNGTSLYTFYVNSPKTEKSIGSVSGLVGDSKLIGIDFRIQNGRFYGVGDQGGVYIVHSSTGVAVKDSQLTVALAGTNFGVDFNPAADRLRVISDTGQNLRHDLNTDSTTPDGTLSYSGGPAAVGLAGAAYTNNDLSPKTGTLLYDLDTALDQIAIQVPANAGTLAVTGPLGAFVNGIAGFDIVTGTNDAGVATSNTAYAVLRSTATSQSSLYRVELQSGDVTRIAPFDRSVADIALQQP